MQIIPKRVFLENNSLHSFPRVCALLFVRDQNAYVAMHKEIFKLRVVWGGSSFFFTSFFLILFPIHRLSQKLRKKKPTTFQWLFNAIMWWNQPVSLQNSLRHQLFTCNFLLWTRFFSFTDSLDFYFPYSKLACSQECLLQKAPSHAGEWGRMGPSEICSTSAEVFGPQQDCPLSLQPATSSRCQMHETRYYIFASN